MLIPYNVDVPMRRLPIANWLLIASTMVISLSILWGGWPGSEVSSSAGLVRAMFVDSDPSENPYDLGYKFTDESPPPPPLSLDVKNFATQQLFTYQFVHDGHLSLIGNMIFLFVFGNAINAKLGHIRYLATYFALSGLSGLAWILFGPGEYVAGSWGVVMGIMGMFIVYYPLNDVLILCVWPLARGADFTQWNGFWLVILYLVVNLIAALYDPNWPWSYFAFMAGAGFGIVLATVLLIFKITPTNQFEENLLQKLRLQPQHPQHRKRKRKRSLNQGRDPDEPL